MCLCPRTIKNPSKHISPASGKYYITVKCGKCAECRKEQELEWQHRTYAVYKYNQLLGGYTLFHTLTYNRESVPYFNGMMCFDPEHIRKFREVLRDKIRRYTLPDGSQPFFDQYKDRFKLIITSEYGGLTHRPHYHCLFTTRIVGLDPMLLHNLIKESWPHGFIDSDGAVPNLIVNSQGVCAYVSKYMYKDDDFVHQLHILQEQDRISVAHGEATEEDYQERYSKQNMQKIYPFHRQSNGYGEEILKLNSYFDLFENGTISMPDKDRVSSDITIPMYIQRKLFYALVDDPHFKDDDGNPRKRWIITNNGIDFKMRHLEESIDKYADNIANKVANIPQQDDNSYYVYNQIFDLLNDRTFNDYAIYVLVYRGKFIKNYLMPSRSLEDLTLSYEYFFYRTLKDTQDSYFTTQNKDIRYSSILIHENSFPEFKDFDKITNLIDNHLFNINLAKNRYYFKIREERNKFKLLKESHLLALTRVNKNYTFKPLKRCAT